jgi:hypothetical protein
VEEVDLQLGDVRPQSEVALEGVQRRKGGQLGVDFTNQLRVVIYGKKLIWSNLSL